MSDRVGLAFITANPATAAFEDGQRAAMAREQAEQQLQGQMLQNAENMAAAPSRLKTVNANANLATTNADVAQKTAPYKVQSAEAGARSGMADARVSEGTVGSRIATSGAAAQTAGANARVASGTVDSRIAAQDAAARTAGANADVAVGTVQPRIDTAQYGAQTAGANANVATGTVQPRIDTAQAGARTADANADVAVNTVDQRVRTGLANTRLAETNADVGEQTADARVQTAQAGARSAAAGAVKAEMEGFYKSLDLLNAGDPASAQEVARAYGSEIPPQVVQDAGLRKEITDAANYAKNAYPNRPADQQKYIQGFIKTRTERMAAGKPQPDPTAVYNVPGAPELPESTATSTQHAPAEVAVATWLMQNKVAANAQEAWDMVRRSKSNPTTVYASVFNNALRANFGNQAKAKQIADDFMKQAGLAGQPTAAPAPAPAAPARAPAPAAAPGAPSAGLPPGQGSQQSPYQATTQQHVNWFKTSAPPGTVISVNGQLYTK